MGPIRLMDTKEQDAIKLVLKDALKEWMDAKYAEFGKWSVHAILAAALAALAYYLISHGHFDLGVRQ